jgi:hypothetical protein
VDAALFTRQIYDFLLLVLLFSPAIGVFLAGARWGRRFSAVALAICIGVMLLTFYMAHSAYQAEFSVDDDHILRAGVGFNALLGAFASIGTLVFRRWPLALALSVTAITLFILSGMPMLFACMIFGACTAYP